MIYEDKNEIKEEVKNENFFKKHIRFIIVMTIILIAVIMTIVFTSIQKITLTQSGNSLVWKYNKSIGNKNFIVVKNNEDILKTKETKFKDETSSDTTPPEKISKVDANYDSEGVSLSWAVPDDKGSSDTYCIRVEDESGKIITKSNELKVETSGIIKEYSVKINGKEYKTDSPLIKILTKDLVQKTYSVEVTAIDSGQNKSDVCLTQIITYKPYIEGNQIKIKDTKNKYTYALSLEDNTVSVVNNKFDSSKLKDITGPQKITNISASIDAKSKFLDFNWNVVKDLPGKYTATIEASNTDGIKLYGTGQVYGNESGVRGYRYSLNNILNYKVSESDNFTLSNFLKRVKVSGTNNYIHIAAVDKDNNIGETTTKLVAIK